MSERERIARRIFEAGYQATEGWSWDHLDRTAPYLRSMALDQADAVLAERAKDLSRMTPAEMSWRDLQRIAALQMQLATTEAQLAQCIADGQRMAGQLDAAEARAERAESTLTAADQEIAERLIVAEARVTALEAEAHVLATTWQANRDAQIAAHGRALQAAEARAVAMIHGLGEKWEMALSNSHKETEQAEARVLTLTEMLRDLQWNTACGGSHCKKCHQWEKQMDDISGWGHASDCPVSALLQADPNP